MPTDGGDDGSVVKRKRGWIFESRSTYHLAGTVVCVMPTVRERDPI